MIHILDVNYVWVTILEQMYVAYAPDPDFPVPGPLPPTINSLIRTLIN